MIPDVTKLLRSFFADDDELSKDERAELGRDADIDEVCQRIQRGELRQDRSEEPS